MSAARPRVLILCCGNPAREDDGIGPAVAALLEQGLPDGVDVSADYQLAVEDAAEVADHEVVIFVDASTDAPEPFELREAASVREPGFSTHAVSPEQVMGLARELFAARTPGYILAVRGYSFRMFCEQMTERGRANAEAAARYLLDTLTSGQAAGAFSLARGSDGEQRTGARGKR